MDDKNSYPLVYNQTISSGNTTTLSGTTKGNSGISIAGGPTGHYYKDNVGTPVDYDYNNITILNTNSNGMNIKQVKVAIFEVKRCKHTQEVTKTKFLKEVWVEQKPNTSLALVVAKYLDPDFDPATIVFREITICSF